MRHIPLGHDDHPTPFAARVVRDPEPVLVLRGEIDLSVAPQLVGAVDEALAGQDRLIVDLSEVTFMDSTGLGVIADAYRRLGGRREAVILRGANTLVQRVLTVTGFDEIVAIEDADRVS